jgi:hypothetical protein
MMTPGWPPERPAAEDSMARPEVSAPPSLAAEIREHRIYYEVQRETAQYGESRITVALQVWLWATVPKKAGSLPGQPGCRAALAALQAAAAEAVAQGAVSPPPDVEPFHWALYGSKHVPDADEIRIELNLRAAPTGPEQALRERALAALRHSLSSLAIYEGGWRAALPAPAAVVPPPPADAWSTRPARDAFGWGMAGAAASPSHA